MRGQDSGKVSPSRVGPVLAQRLPQVLMLWGDAGGHWVVVLHEGRHDPLQDGLYQVRTASLFSDHLDLFHFVIDLLTVQMDSVPARK